MKERRPQGLAYSWRLFFLLFFLLQKKEKKDRQEEGQGRRPSGTLSSLLSFLSTDRPFFILWSVDKESKR